MSCKRHLRSRASLALVFVLGFAALGGDCDGDIAQDPTFRDWCGDSLCAWKLDLGHVSRVPTWNENDFGVSFQTDPTQISQITDESSATCILFTTVADIDPAADMTLSVDFNSDGSFEYTTTLGATQWQEVTEEITAPSAYQGITFVIRKGGAGTATLAEMRIQSTSGCTAAPRKIKDHSLQLGEKCATSAECRSDLTCTGVSGDLLCSQCSSSEPCAGGAVCKARSVFLPSQCGPGEKLGKEGEPCLTDTDCASEICEGAMPIALTLEAGTCDLDGSLGDADPSNCKWYGARGGKCQ
jgi:hypothetical protein